MNKNQASFDMTAYCSWNDNLKQSCTDTPELCKMDFFLGGEEIEASIALNNF